MSEISYFKMITGLSQKTENRQAIWNKGSRSNEFSITFKTGTFVIDKWLDSDDEATYCDFQIYNDTGDKIYSSTPLPDNQLYDAIMKLHDVVSRRFYKVDETIQGFHEEIDGNNVVGMEREESTRFETSGGSA